MLMPDLRIRYLPSTIRLRELIATQIGRPLHLEARLTVKSADERPGGRLGARVVEVLDWFRAIAGTAPLRVVPVEGAATDNPDTHAREIEFARPAKGGEPTRGRWITEPHALGAAASRTVELSIRCERGSARITHPTEIEWRNGDGNETPIRESLTGERDDLELMLDHFARRVAGGLVPVPTFEDLEHAWRLSEAE